VFPAAEPSSGLPEVDGRVEASRAVATRPRNRVATARAAGGKELEGRGVGQGSTGPRTASRDTNDSAGAWRRRPRPAACGANTDSSSSSIRLGLATRPSLSRRAALAIDLVLFARRVFPAAAEGRLAEGRLPSRARWANTSRRRTHPMKVAVAFWQARPHRGREKEDIRAAHSSRGAPASPTPPYRR
jgi:hypothetical protein